MNDNFLRIALVAITLIGTYKAHAELTHQCHASIQGAAPALRNLEQAARANEKNMTPDETKVIEQDLVDAKASSYEFVYGACGFVHHSFLGREWNESISFSKAEVDEEFAAAYANQ